MIRGPMCLVLLIISLTACFVTSFGYSQDTMEELKERLKDLREKKAIALIEQDEEMHKINKAAEDKMTRIKSDFRKAHDECLREKQNKMKTLIEDYESKLKPMLKEEEELAELVGPKEAMNFARTKAEKERINRREGR